MADVAAVRPIGVLHGTTITPDVPQDVDVCGRVGRVRPADPGGDFIPIVRRDFLAEAVNALDPLFQPHIVAAVPALGQENGPRGRIGPGQQPTPTHIRLLDHPIQRQLALEIVRLVMFMGRDNGQRVDEAIECPIGFGWHDRLSPFRNVKRADDLKNGLVSGHPEEQHFEIRLLATRRREVERRLMINPVYGRRAPRSGHPGQHSLAKALPRQLGDVAAGQDESVRCRDARGQPGEFPVVARRGERPAIRPGEAGRIEDHQVETVAALRQPDQPVEHISENEIVRVRLEAVGAIVRLAPLQNRLRQVEVQHRVAPPAAAATPKPQV